MNIATLCSVLNAALKNESLSLTDPIAGLNWTADLKAALGTNFQVSSLHLGAAGLAVAAANGSVRNDRDEDLPSAVLFGSSDSDLLNIPKAQIELTLYVTPVDPQNDSNILVDFTLIAQIKSADWTPADSFPGLQSSFVFSHLIANQAPSFLLTSFAHEQQWHLGGPAPTFSNAFRSLSVGLNLQVPAGLPTDVFPALANLFGDLSLGSFFFNGPVDNSQTSKDPQNITLRLLADLGDNHNATLSGNSPITLEFDAGFEAYPATSDTDDPTQNATLLASQLVLQATIGHVLIQALVSLNGESLSFSMNGLEDQPAISLSDIASLFEQSTLSQNLPSSIQQNQGPNGFFKHIGIQNLGLEIDIPKGGKPAISNISLSVGYENGPAIGYQPWFDLKTFSVNWWVGNPFPLSGAQTKVTLDGDFELLGGDISFEANFGPAQNVSPHPTDTSSWVFDINGGLVDGSSIPLTKLFEQFSSHSDDFPDITIDGLAFMAQPDQQVYSGSIDLEIEWKFQNFKAPLIKGFSADLQKNKNDITGSISAQIEIGTGDDAPVFDLSAERSDTDWTFSAKSDHPFNIGELADGFGFEHPDYLNHISIVQTSISYIAPIKSDKPAPKKAADAPPDSTFEIVIEAKFPIAGEALDVTITYHVDKDGWEFKGSLLVGPEGQPGKALEFDFDATGKSGDPKKTETTLVATLKSGSGKSLNISDFAAAFNAPAPPIPEALNDLEITSATIEYDTGTAGKGLLLNAVSALYGQLVFAIVKTGTDTAAVWKPFFALAFKPTLDFSKLPVIGSYIEKVAQIEVNQIQIAGLPKEMAAADLTELSTLFSNAQVPTSLIPNVEAGKGLPAEAIFNAVLQVNEDKKPINLVVNGNGISSGGTTQPSTPTLIAADNDTAKIPANNGKQGIDKTFGPVHLTGFNLGYSNGQIGLDISGELTLGGITMSFQGMGIKMKFPPKEISDVSFQLHGLGVNVNKGGLRIAGGFISIGDNCDNFMGMLAITAGTIGMQAYGGYATTTPEPSFFIFVHVEVPIGGPPFFFVDGIAGGFGLNRKFVLPDFAELPSFPLLPSAANNPIPSGAPSSLNDITQALTQLAKFIPPQSGAYWIAAGLDFTSFELLQVSAILEVSFGVGFQLGLIGSAALSIPEPAEPIAFVQLDFEVDYNSDAGFLAVLAELTPASYVFASACHLTGGFAFYIWFKDQPTGAREGDFMVTIGGYNPAFVKPAWYPSVPRLGMSWDLGPLKIRGQSYFALTPHLLMAGLEMTAVFDIKVVKATFDAGFDFLLGWKPFFYYADAFIHIDIELHLLFTLHFHVGVDLDIWGPEFGGKARVDLSIFSFTIHFGSDGPTPPPISWGDFKKLLPNAQPQSSQPALAMQAAAAAVQPFSVSQVDLSAGMLQTLNTNPLSTADLNNEKVFNWQIDPNDFSFLLLAGVPCNNFWFNNQLNNGSNAVNARVQPKDSLPSFTPSNGQGIYVKTDDEAKFYARPNGASNLETIFAYDVPEKITDAWWMQDVQVGPVNIPAGVFNNDGSRASGFTSTFIVNVYSLDEDGNSIKTDFENNFVVTLLSKNAAKSLWGGLVDPKNGNEVLNTPRLLTNTLFGLTLTPKIWNPLQTRDIQMYLLLFDDGRNLCWPTESGPAVEPNNFKETVSADGDTMSFQLPNGAVVQNRFRHLDSQAFSNVAAGAQLIESLNTLFGYDLNVSTDTAGLSAPMYSDWPIMALLGEETAEAANII